MPKPLVSLAVSPFPHPAEILLFGRILLSLPTGHLFSLLPQTARVKNIGREAGRWPFYDEGPRGPQVAAGAAQHGGGKTRRQCELPSLSRPDLFKEALDNIKWAGLGKKGREGASRRPALGEGGGCLAAHHAAADRQGGRLAGSL